MLLDDCNYVHVGTWTETELDGYSISVVIDCHCPVACESVRNLSVTEGLSVAIAFGWESSEVMKVPVDVGEANAYSGDLEILTLSIVKIC